MSIPLLLVCDGAESKQATLEGLVKNEPGLKYIATASMQEGTRAVERAVKVGAKLVWIDLDEEPVEGLNLLAETRKLHPMLNVIVSRSQLDPDMVRAALQLGALDFLDPARAAQQLNVVVENLKTSGQVQSTVSQASVQAVTLAPVTTDPNLSPGARPNLTPGAGGAKPWGDLDSIPTPGAPGARIIPPIGQDVTGEIHVASSGIQNLVASQAQSAVQGAAQARPTTDLPGGGGKWGDSDSIPTPGAAPAAPAPAPAALAPAPAASTYEHPAHPTPHPPVPAAAPAQPAAQIPAVAPAQPTAQIPAVAPAQPTAQIPAVPPAQPAAQEAVAAAAPAPMAAPPLAPATAPGASSTNNPASSTNNPSGGRWGDLDAIPTPKAAQEGMPKPTAEIARPTAAPAPASALDSIPTPAERPPLPKPEPHVNTNKALRPSPEKAELYSMGSPVMMAVVIILIIFAAIAFMYFKQHH